MKPGHADVKRNPPEKNTPRTSRRSEKRLNPADISTLTRIKCVPGWWDPSCQTDLYFKQQQRRSADVPFQFDLWTLRFFSVLNGTQHNEHARWHISRTPVYCLLILCPLQNKSTLQSASVSAACRASFTSATSVFYSFVFCIMPHGDSAAPRRPRCHYVLVFSAVRFLVVWRKRAQIHSRWYASRMSKAEAISTLKPRK